ncbi:hypothetical protein JD844_001288 [Phrynosoma platyrhinos]|uniref:VWFA domain-containing protein n=1 Tax=Phrynosoma platyrhinos TaxID=52577 RepID=A0ABQ7T9F3_PHRPL|nr:hypothetical protein JD844_001288 [Phrynosoma platyrhinos]
MKSLKLFVYLPAVLTSCHGFSLDTEHPITFQEAAMGFGQSVVQFGSGANAGYGTTLLITITLCLTTSNHCPLIPQVCGPTVHQTCGENIYLKGYCFLLDQNLREIKRFPESLPECPKRLTDIVFLIDGSGSINPREFSQMKTFVSEVMKRFQNMNTQFALSQYARRYREHFDFLEFQRTRDPDELLRRVQQLQGATLTATYIQKVVRELFVPEKGSRHGASKVLIVITDGEKTGDPLEYSDVIPQAEQAGIIRFAIGVGEVFSKGRANQELISIASSPAADHVFPVNNFDALKDIQNRLQDKIFAIEGTQSKSSSSFQLEMSQEGFSALLTPDGPALGAVGAYDWSGGIFLYGSRGDSNFINVSSLTKDMNDAYLGYSMQIVQLNGQNSYVLGAPRYQHSGRVIWFTQNNGQWEAKSELSIKEPLQIGSYFGAALCSVDLDRDTNTDLVLIGAPLYYDSVAGGRVYICERKGESFFCGKELHGEAKHPLGRFGASIVEIGEVTGDRWTDVAVGAPMEDENRGAVYIFRGKSRSINQAYSQRIQGSKLTNRLHYFGQTIGGGSDLTGDGLPDVAVGAEGQVLLLRSRPVLQVSSRITFTPSTIPISAFECQDQEVLNKEISKATVCLIIQSDSRFKLGNSISSTIRYTLSLDYGRTMIRAIFDGSSGTSIINEEMQVGLTTNCKEYRIKLPTCIEDSLTPISLRLNYTLTGDPIRGSNNLRAILGEDEPHQFTASLPFEKNCGRDGVCKDALKTSFNFSGLDTLVVGLTPEVNATVFIRNDGEDSYSTTLTFLYPSAFPTGSMWSLNVPLSLLQKRTLSGTLPVISITPSSEVGLSENNGPITQDMVHQGKLTVKYAVYVFVNTMDESTKYVNFSAGQENQSQIVEHLYEVKNTYQRKVPVSVLFQFPVELNGIRVWNASLDIAAEFFHLAHCVPEKQTPGSKDFVKQLKERPILDCTVATCKTVRCDIPSLELKRPLEFRIKGDIGFKWVSETQQKKVTLMSSAKISYDEKKYFQKEGFVQNQAKTVVEHLVPYNYLPIIIGSSIGGLVLLALIVAALYKLGFFKRQYKAMMDEAGDGGNEVAGPSQDSISPSPAATKG